MIILVREIGSVNFFISGRASSRRHTKLGLTYFDIKYENEVTSYLSGMMLLNRGAQVEISPQNGWLISDVL
jgi:hypothetical protein